MSVAVELLSLEAVAPVELALVAPLEAEESEPPPPVDDVAPVDEAVPVDDDAAPVDGDASPVDEEPAPVDDDVDGTAAPVDEDGGAGTTGSGKPMGSGVGPVV